jgi:hypothetical protein
MHTIRVFILRISDAQDKQKKKKTSETTLAAFNCAVDGRKLATGQSLQSQEEEQE